MRFDVQIERDEDGKFCVSCPVLPGCHSQGDTREEAIENIKEAISLYLEDLDEHGDPFPAPTSREVVEVEFGKAG